MLTVKRRKTLSDLMSLPPETRAELIDGEIYMSPAPGLKHQTAVLRLGRFLDEHVQPRRLGRVCVAPFDVILGEETVEPDVLFISAGRIRILGENRAEGAPDLVVEVLSPSTEVRDRVVKRDLYAKNGVREYWIVDVDRKTVEVLKLEKGAYALQAVFETGDRVASTVLPDLDLSIDRLFE